MFTQGYIKKHRTCLEWRWRRNPLIVALWDFILLSANYKEAEFESLTIQRGQFVTSLNSLSSKTGISNQSVRTSLKKLESSGELTIKTTNKFTVITIINYDSYQSRDDDTNMRNNKRLTNDQQTTNKRLTTIEERQERKEEQEIVLHTKKRVKKVMSVDDFIAQGKTAVKLPDGTTSNNVFLSEIEKEKLVKTFKKKFGEDLYGEYLQIAVQKLDTYITNHKKGKEYVDHYKVILDWPLDKAVEKHMTDIRLNSAKERAFIQSQRN